MRHTALPLRSATWVLVVHCSVAFASAGTFALPAAVGNEDRRCLACVGQLRGGAPPFDTHASHPRPPTLGDVDAAGFYRPPVPHHRQQPRPPPLIPLIRDYLVDLHRCSPTLFHGTLGSVLLFLLWQLPPSSAVARVLRHHFTTSADNVLRRRRCHALLLSAFSHASFRHLALNVYAFLTFGRSAARVLAGQGLALWPFACAAAVVGNLTFLLFDGGHGSCVGLSGVTLALVAFDSLVHPAKELRLFVSFVPITLPAYYLFVGLLGFTVLGLLGAAGRSDVAHATHLGGLLYGALFYEAFKRGWPRQWNYRLRKAMASRGG